MHYRTLFPSKYISAEDLRGRVVPLVIERMQQEEMPNGDGESKPVLYFRRLKKGMVLNKTNAKRIAQMHGVDTDSWMGRTIHIYPSETDLRGETVPCIRVKLIEPDDLQEQRAVLPITPPGGGSLGQATDPHQAVVEAAGREVAAGPNGTVPTEAERELDQILAEMDRAPTVPEGKQ